MVVALLEGQIADDDRHLLHDDLHKFKVRLRPLFGTAAQEHPNKHQSNIDKVNTALSIIYQQRGSALASMLDPDGPISIHDLPETIAKLQTSAQTSTTDLQKYRLALADEVVQLHTLYRQVLARSIHLLEQVLHGSSSRSASARCIPC